MTISTTGNRRGPVKGVRNEQSTKHHSCPWGVGRRLQLERLVCIASFGLDERESLGGLLSQGPTPPALAHQLVDKRGFVWLPEQDFVNYFAADADPVKARVMYAVQQPLAATAFNQAMGVPAWKSLPSWYLIATDDQALPPAAQHLFAKRMAGTVVQIPPSHVAMVSHPRDVVRLTETAAETISATAV